MTNSDILQLQKHNANLVKENATLTLDNEELRGQVEEYDTFLRGRCICCSHWTNRNKDRDYCLNCKHRYLHREDTEDNWLFDTKAKLNTR